MFFRRKKQPDTDQTTVLTETLRSLEDLIAETPEPAPTDTGEKTVAAVPQEATKKDRQDREDRSHFQARSGVTEEDQIPDITVDDDLPVLTDVVYMPTPRVAAADTTAASRTVSIDAARKTIVKKLVNAVGDLLDTNGQPLDPALIQDLQDAVSASLEDWEIRTQEILRKRFTPPTNR